MCWTPLCVEREREREIHDTRKAHRYTFPSLERCIIKPRSILYPSPCAGCENVEAHCRILDTRHSCRTIAICRIWNMYFCFRCLPIAVGGKGGNTALFVFGAWRGRPSPLSLCYAAPSVLTRLAFVWREPRLDGIRCRLVGSEKRKGARGWPTILFFFLRGNECLSLGARLLTTSRERRE